MDEISGNSMSQWLLRLDEYHSAIWKKVSQGGAIDFNNNEENLFTLDIEFETFRIFGFLDDTTIMYNIMI